MIGIGSIERNAGVTFICLALSNFLCNKLGKKTAYIELNTTNQIYSLNVCKKNKNFSYCGIDIFPCVSVTSLSEIIGLNYDFFVLDMGVLNTYTIKEFFKCESRFIVCSLSKWKLHINRERLEKLLHQTYTNQAQVTVLNNLSAEKSTFSIRSRLDMPIISFPYIPNPFQLKPEMFYVFHQILERN